MEYTKVKDNETLVRDENSRAVINTDSKGLAHARMAKQKIMERIENEKNLESRISDLEGMVKQLINRLDK